MKISRKRRTKFIHRGNENRKFMQFYFLVNETLNERILFHVFTRRISCCRCFADIQSKIRQIQVDSTNLNTQFYSRAKHRMEEFHCIFSMYLVTQNHPVCPLHRDYWNTLYVRMYTVYCILYTFRRFYSGILARDFSNPRWTKRSQKGKQPRHRYYGTNAQRNVIVKWRSEKSDEKIAVEKIASLFFDVLLA